MIKVPPYLQPGATVGITCPAGAVNLEGMKYMFHQLNDWGLPYKLGSTVGNSFHKFSADDEERARDLQTMLDDDEIQAILFGRGGYGVVRIIDKLDFSKFVKNPKWLLGYSDITCLHSHLHTQFQISSIHAHMSGGYQPQDFDKDSTQSIFNVLKGEPIKYTVAPHRMNRLGQAVGSLVGGNLALLSDLIGTPSDLDTSGKILFIEDIAEYKYNIDRMLWQLKRSGKLNNLAGLVVGGFTDSKDDEIPFGLSEYEMILEKIVEYNYPVCFDFPVGHQSRNVALKCGVNYTLEVNKNYVELKEENAYA